MSVTGTTFEDNVRHAVTLTSIDRPRVSDNTFYDNGYGLVERCLPYWAGGACSQVRSVPVQVAGDLDLSKLGGNRGSGNGTDSLMLNGHVVAGSTWPSSSWPIVIGGRPFGGWWLRP